MGFFDDKRKGSARDLRGSSRTPTGERTRPTAADRASTAALARALGRTLKLLRHASSEGSVEQLSTLASIQQDLGAALVAPDFEAIAKRLEAVRVAKADGASTEPPAATGRAGSSLSDPVRVFVAAARASRPVFERLEAKPLLIELRALQRVLALEGDDAKAPLPRWSAMMSKGAERIGRLKESSKLMRSCVDELIDTLGHFAGDEAEARAKLETIRQELHAAEELRELEALRRSLVAHATSLAEAAAVREEAARRAEAAAQASRERAGALEAALLGAEELARTDPLTGLGNRRALEEAVAAHEEAHVQPIGVLVLDLDHFKQVNDRFGHAGGDAVLREVAAVLRGELRGDDGAYRVGGEELVLLLPRCSWQGARATAERLRARIAAEPIAIGEVQIGVTASLGVSLWEPSGRFDAAQQEADDAVYRAKEAGRNRVVG
ncbi:MAG: GGDEF domain-containing protein [Myxococcota bacterium]